MKKIIMLIVAMVLALFIVANAEGIDLSGMSDSELKDLQDDLSKELSSRGILRSGDLVSGTYIVGKDIGSGTYDVTARSVCAWYFVYPSEDVYDRFNELSRDIDIKIVKTEVFADKPNSLTLVDGNILWVDETIILKEKPNSLMP